jgi:hypothetical protein
MVSGGCADTRCAHPGRSEIEESLSDFIRIPCIGVKDSAVYFELCRAAVWHAAPDTIPPLPRRRSLF